MGSSIIKLIEENDNLIKVEKEGLSSADVVIDFSHPDSTIEILDCCLKHQKPLVIGTTGLKEDHIKKLKKASKIIPIIIGSNMSKGIIDLKESLKEYLNNNYESMDCVIEETHHKEKIDSPSGTAIELKEHILSKDINNNIKSLEIISNRVGNIFGVHKVSFIKEETLKEFQHEAMSRDVFAYGALHAAKKICELDPSIYRFQDI